MIAVDTNLLVYAHRRDAEWHDSAATLLKQLDFLTSDRDFSRFPRLPIRHPLIAEPR